MKLLEVHQATAATLGAPRQQLGSRAAAAARCTPARRRVQPARAEPQWNEGAAQVRRLVDRDRKELDLDDLEATFAEDPAPTSSAASEDAASGSAEEATPRSPFQATSSAADKTPVSPFGPSSGGSSSPFGGAGGGVKRPFVEPAGLSPNMPTPQKVRIFSQAGSLA